MFVIENAVATTLLLFVQAAWNCPQCQVFVLTLDKRTSRSFKMPIFMPVLPSEVI